MASSFSNREINRLYYGTIIKFERMIIMLWIGIAFILVGVFLVGKSSK